MSNHLTELRNYMELASSHGYSQPLYEDVTTEDETIVEVAPDTDELVEKLELLRFKLLNQRVITESADYDEGYEVACIKIAEMIDGIIQTR